MVFPILADKKGRQKCIRLSWFIGSIGCIIMLVENEFCQIFGYFLAGFGINPSTNLQLSMINEHSGKNYHFLS